MLAQKVALVGSVANERVLSQAFLVEPVKDPANIVVYGSAHQVSTRSHGCAPARLTY